MAKLFKIDKNEQAHLLLSNLEKAESFFRRGKGLLGRRSLEEGSGLWINPCRDIHTFFMKFAIDCIFVNKKMVIVKMHQNVKPFRFVGPVWKSQSVIEVPAGSAQKWNLKSGDQLYVVS